jgi:DNA modification methylase
MLEASSIGGTRNNRPHKVYSWRDQVWFYNCDCADLFPKLGSVSLFFTSPPYNIGSNGPKKSFGLRRYGIYDPKSWGSIEDYPDSLPEEVYEEQQRNFLRKCHDCLQPGGVVVYNHKDRRRDHTIITPYRWFPECLVVTDVIHWNRGSTHNHDSTHTYQQMEYLFVMRRAEDRRCYFKNLDTGIPGNRSNLWSIPFSRKSWHNAPFPLELATSVLIKWSPPGSLVCDPYAGSGTTAVAALKTGRRFVGSEMKREFFLKAADRIEHEHN